MPVKIRLYSADRAGGGQRLIGTPIIARINELKKTPKTVVESSSEASAVVEQPAAMFNLKQQQFEQQLRQHVKENEISHLKTLQSISVNLQNFIGKRPEKFDICETQSSLIDNQCISVKLVLRAFLDNDGQSEAVIRKTQQEFFKLRSECLTILRIH
jgi:hypothetical protein